MIETHIQQLAKQAALVDPLDLPGLVSLGELFEELYEMLDAPEYAPLSEKARESVDLLESIVMHEVVDLDQTFAEINRTIDYAQEIVNALQDGLSVDDVPVPGRDSGSENAGIDPDLLASWLSGCTDILEELESLTVGLETDPTDEDLSEVRRGIHTLKGECGVLSLAVAQKICHEAETLIDETAGQGKAFPASEILAVLDWMKAYSQLLESDPTADAPEHGDLLASLATKSTSDGDQPGPDIVPEPADSAEAESQAACPAEADDGSLVEFPSDIERDDNLADFLGEAREHIAAGEVAVLSLENDFTDLELINTVFRAFHTIKGVAGFMNLTPIVTAAHNAEYLLDEARKQTITLNSASLDLILESCDMMSQLLAVLEGERAPSLSAFNHHIEQLQLASKNEPFVTSRGASEPAAQSSQSPVAEKTNPTDAQESAKAQASSPSGAKKKSSDVNVKVNTERLDNLVTMVGELVIAQQMVIQDPSVSEIEDQRFQRNMSQTGKIIRDLQEVAMSLRMVTLKGLFQKMARLVRDVSAKADKKVQFIMEGEDTELDRTVVEEIGDPLVHSDQKLLRPRHRVAAGSSKGWKARDRHPHASCVPPRRLDRHRDRRRRQGS